MLIDLEINNIISKNIISDRDVLTVDKSIIELSKSIKERGLLQPIVVKKASDDKYRVVCGQRRIIACKLLGHTKIASIIKEFADIKEEITCILDENTKRKKLNNYENFILNCKILYILSKKEKNEEIVENLNSNNYDLIMYFKKMTIEQINKNKKKNISIEFDEFERNCQAIGVSQKSILNNKFLLDCHPEIIKFLENNKITMQIAYLLNAKSNQTYFIKLIDFIKENEKVTITNIKSLISAITKQNNKTTVLDKERLLKVFETKDPKIISYLNSLAVKLEKKITIKTKKLNQ